MIQKIQIIILAIACFTSCTKEPIESADNQKPTLEITKPENNAVYTIGDSIFITAEANDSDGEISNVLFYNQGQLFKMDSVYPFEASLIFWKAENIDISAKAIDNQGLASEKQTVIVHISDDSIPHATQKIEAKYILEGDDLSIKVHSDSPNGKIKKLEFYVNDNIYATDTIQDTKFIIESLNLGTYKTYVFVTDEIGKTAKSDDLIFTVEENQAPTVSLSSSSYYDIFPGGNINISIKAIDLDGEIDSLLCYVNDSLFYKSVANDRFDINYYPKEGGTYSFRATVYDNKQSVGYSNIVEVKVNPGFTVEGKLVDLTHSNYDNLVFGLDRQNSKLLLLNPIDSKKEEISLPYSNPVKFKYSMNLQKLYIIYDNNGMISIWDYNTNSLSEYTYSETAGSKDIEIDDSHNRIYVLGTNGLNIINQENGNLITNQGLYNMDDIVLDPEKRQLVGCDNNNDIYLTKYDIKDDFPIAIESASYSNNYRYEMKLNKENEYFIIPGLGSYYTCNTISIQDINSVTGYYSFNFEPYDFCEFSPDERFLFAAIENSYNNSIYVMNAITYEYIDEIYSPNSDKAIMCTNISQNKLIISTHSSYGESNFRVFFIDIDY